MIPPARTPHGPSPAVALTLGVAAALGACGGEDVGVSPDAVPPPRQRIERLALDVCGELNRTVTAAFMHEGYVFLGCTGGSLGSSWFRYDTKTGQRAQLADVIGSAFCGVSKRGAVLTYHACATPPRGTTIFQRSITGGDLTPPQAVIDVPTIPRLYTETDSTFYYVASDPDTGADALWRLVRPDIGDPFVEVVTRFASSTYVGGLAGDDAWIYTREDGGGGSRLLYRSESALDQGLDLLLIGHSDGWFDHYQGAAVWFGDYEGDLRMWTVTSQGTHWGMSSGCPLVGAGVRANDLLAFPTSGRDGGPACGDRYITFDLVSGARRAADPPSFEIAPSFQLVGADAENVYGYAQRDEYTADLLSISTEPI